MQLTHQKKENANCTVSIYNDEIGQWVSKEDTGKESFTEKEKGLASDSFKRACFNWGIGRELYTAPFIWIPSDKCEIKQTGRKDQRGNDVLTCYDRFRVTQIVYDDNRNIIALAIKNDSRSRMCYTYDNRPKADKKR